MAGQTAMSTPIFDELLREMAANSAKPEQPKQDAAEQAEAKAGASAGRRRRPE
ncbi:hypothetical protein SAMN05192558_105458 [Actinokineospora alba]|uniref:Uncharacterized protein n=1 Tax=Actinokineospora alba TaxID=504798 RepID=A0A1H0NS26_9PSEU|nr:hypothetical protein [Actinokineospora alba]TDP68826.1 hypothetical protein C8E96_4393 [Actinokineospora alba]SDH87515.1 hypothetical protein SAMN05421871_102508 [Actinokineospora alba]SDO95469.1 hypothetical protein SAMN05192558_105458 [Actinokineospora alba]